MNSPKDTTQAAQAAIADTTRPNWTGLNAIELYDAGRLTDQTLKQWAIDSCNEHIADKFSPSLMNRVETQRAINYFDAYVEAFIGEVKSKAAALSAPNS